MQKLEAKAKHWAKVIGHLPGVSAVFLSGSVAQGLGRDDSDIDFFVVAYPGYIWTARFFTNLILKLTFNLSKPQHHAARICPNHFITADSLEIVEKDAYSAHLFSHNQALYDPHGLWPQFVEKNTWVNEFGESFEVVVKSQIKQQRPLPALSSRVRVIESILKKIQTWKIYRNPDFKKPGAKIVLRDTELRFHPDPKNQYWQGASGVDLGKKARQAEVEIVNNASS